MTTKKQVETPQIVESRHCPAPRNISMDPCIDSDQMLEIEPLLPDPLPSWAKSCYRDPSARQVQQWLRETRGVMRNPVLEYLRLPTRVDRQGIQYSGDMTTAQEANAVLDLQDGEPPRVAAKYVQRRGGARQSISDNALPTAQPKTMRSES